MSEYMPYNAERITPQIHLFLHIPTKKVRSEYKVHINNTKTSTTIKGRLCPNTQDTYYYNIGKDVF